MKRTKSCIGVNRGAWTAAEDLLLKKQIQLHGERHWNSIAYKAGLQRTGKSCRLRWMNYLRPSIKRGHISADEEDLIIRLHKLLGNRWSLIAGRMPGRTDNEIKNYWNTHLGKKIGRKDSTRTKQRYKHHVGSATDQNEQVCSETEIGRTDMDNIIATSELMGSAESEDYSLCTKQGYKHHFGAATHLQLSSDQNEQVCSETERGRTDVHNIIATNELMGSAESEDYSVCIVKDQTSFSYEEIESDLLEIDWDIQWNISSSWGNANYKQFNGCDEVPLQGVSIDMEEITDITNDASNIYHVDCLPNSSFLLSGLTYPPNFCWSSPDTSNFCWSSADISFNMISNEPWFPNTAEEISNNSSPQAEISALFF